MLLGYVSDEYYAALSGVDLEFRGAGDRVAVVRSGDRDVVVSTTGGPDAPTETRFWELDGGTPVGPVLVGTVPAPLATAEVDGRGVLVTSAADGAAVWDLAELIGEGAR